MVCFCYTVEPYCSDLFVINEQRFVKFKYSTDCLIHKTAISDSGRFIVFQTANSPDALHHDGHRLFFADADEGILLWSIVTETKFQTVDNYFIDESNETILEFHKDYTVVYDFSGVFLNRMEWIEYRINHSDVTFYELLNLASKLIDEEPNNILRLQTANSLIQNAISLGIASEYQLGMIYKKLGDCYFAARNGSAALACYKSGLKYYPKLPVKRVIKTLENSIG